MKILVIGGTGMVGAEVVRELIARKAEVYVLTRDKTKALPQGTQRVVGDLLDPTTVRSIFKGMDGVFLLNAVSTTEGHEGLMALNGMKMSGVKRVVYLSVQNADRAPHLPHFGSKVAVEIAIKDSDIAYTILRPNNFYQNDYWFKDVLLSYGVYPQPIGNAGLSRVDTRDIAEAAAIALTGGHDGQVYNLVGPELMTGQGTAEAWGRALGKKIAYAGDDLDAWEKQSLQFMPPWLVFDFKQMYAYFQQHGLKGTQEDINRQTKLLGHPPRKFEDFVRETAKVWKG
jgi:uncharacterized protein YbjT (DUF2867 family)